MHDSDWDNMRSLQPKPVEVRDPVCGVRIDPRHSAATRTIRGESVFFCSTLCLEKFDINPGHYEHAPAR